MTPAETAPWWKRYPEVRSGYLQDPRPNDIPDSRLLPGTPVRLCGKPDRARKVLTVQWHYYRYRYVYVIETSGGTLPYWFADQLMLEGENQPVQELSQQRAEETLWHKLKAVWRSRFS